MNPKHRDILNMIKKHIEAEHEFFDSRANEVMESKDIEDLERYLLQLGVRVDIVFYIKKYIERGSPET